MRHGLKPSRGATVVDLHGLHAGPVSVRPESRALQLRPEASAAPHGASRPNLDKLRPMPRSDPMTTEREKESKADGHGTLPLVVRVIRHETPMGPRYQFACRAGHLHESRAECAQCSRQQ
jgi:hypothetical protein